MLHQNQIVIIFWKRVLKQAVRGAEEKSEITAIPNKYKDTLDNLINSSDIEFSDYPNSPNWPGLIDTKRSRNAPKFKNGSPTFLKKDCLDEDISITLLEPVPKICDFQVHQHYNVATFGVKSERVQYGKGQQDGKDEKGKKGGEDGEGEKSGESHWGNKVNSMIRKNGGSKASVYYHIIYEC